MLLIAVFLANFELFQATGIEPVVRNWCKIDDGPASALARKIVKTWQSLNNSSRSWTGGSSSASLSSRSSTSNVSSHKNGRSFNRHLLKSPSLSPSSDSDNENETTTAKSKSEGATENNIDVKSSNFSNLEAKQNTGQGNTNGDSNKSPSISISSSSDDDEKRPVAETNINKIISTLKQPETTDDNPNDLNSSPSLICHDASQLNSSNIKATENNESYSFSVPELEKSEIGEAVNCQVDKNPQLNQELYSPGNPTGGGGAGDLSLSNSDSSNSPGLPLEKSKEETSSSNDVSKESTVSPKGSVTVASNVVSSIVGSVDDWRVSHQSEKLKNLKRRAALICNLPELASSATSDKDRERRSGSGSPRKRKKYKKERKSRERRSKKKSSRRKDHRRDYSDSRSRKGKSKSKSRSETKDNNMQYDSLSGEDSRSD